MVVVALSVLEEAVKGKKIPASAGGMGVLWLIKNPLITG